MCMQVKQYMFLLETMRTHNNIVTFSGEAIETDENLPFGTPFDKRPGHWSRSGKPAPKRCGYGCGYGYGYGYGYGFGYTSIFLALKMIQK